MIVNMRVSKNVVDALSLLDYKYTRSGGELSAHGLLVYDSLGESFVSLPRDNPDQQDTGIMQIGDGREIRIFRAPDLSPYGDAVTKYTITTIRVVQGSWFTDVRTSCWLYIWNDGRAQMSGYTEKEMEEKIWALRRIGIDFDVEEVR